jgi:hypothetical protein
MKSYVFSDRERKIMKGFLSGELPANNPAVMQVKSRMKGWVLLREDVELYLALSRRFAESESA